jgi:hypothetical protein
MRNLLLVWVDDACEEANHSASSENVNYGVSDGLVKINGQVYGNNCGFSRPVTLSING